MSVGLYVLLRPPVMAEIVAEHAALLERFARGEPGALEVLQDAIVARAEWCSPSWKEALCVREKRRKLNLFFVGRGRLSQNIIRAARPQRVIRRRGADGSSARDYVLSLGRPARRGWEEIEAIKRIRRAMRAEVQKRHQDERLCGAVFRRIGSGGPTFVCDLRRGHDGPHIERLGRHSQATEGRGD